MSTKLAVLSLCFLAKRFRQIFFPLIFVHNIVIKVVNNFWRFFFC